MFPLPTPTPKYSFFFFSKVSEMRKKIQRIEEERKFLKIGQTKCEDSKMLLMNLEKGVSQQKEKWLVLTHIFKVHNTNANSIEKM